MRNFCFVFLFSIFAIGQTQYPKDYFRSPLDIPLQLSGNFGELRPNHIHSGFDFKTQQKEGLNVYAAADGYISRINVCEVGYGKAVYITHPNGYTTVYGHLQSGFGKIEKYIKTAQYKAKSYEIDVPLNPNELVVKKGDIIAVSGNTGGSDGPHLHFEIRDTQSEKIINPMYFGYDTLITDSKRPAINSLWVYPLDVNSIVNESKRPISVNLSLQNDGSYLAEKISATGKIGFGITAFDYDDVSWNSNGIFRVQTFLNGKSDFGFQFDTFSFDETRFVNLLIDYARYKKLGQRVQKLFVKNSYPLSIIKPGSNNGVISVSSNITQSYRIEVADFSENIAKIFIPIQYSALPAKVEEVPITSKYYVKAKKENIFSLENVTVNFPTNTFYDDFYMNFEVKKGTLKLHEDIVPAFSNFSITFEDSITPQKDREKMFIGLVNEKKISYYNTKRYKNSFTIYTKYLGEYKLIKDGKPPKIKLDKHIGGKWISNLNELKFTISDELSGIKSYYGYLNGKWILLEYEPKTKKLIHRFSDGIVAEGENDLKVVITDNVGNSTIFETQFFRSQKP
ncbi:M23 family metallopeptidase [Flavobacterium paronense]|uniref:M23 family metallopeptidase n=1 Tax=Flavobacterium paronense TaxID=1392775 RepID=A0ABV5GDP0_9FLAO|nr:M23 family metallopeptidase [Flavobacterium paronense]MDN3677912.1 M23 family metallopeptidase [Flavobacterium paronense]